MPTALLDDELWRLVEPLLPVRRRRFYHPGRKRLQELKEWADYFTEALNRIGAQWVARRNRVKEGRR